MSVASLTDKSRSTSPFVNRTMSTSAITPEQFSARVRALEARAEADPRGYKLRVGLVAALGYVYLGSVLLAAVGVIVAMVYFGATTSGGRSLLRRGVWVIGGLGYLIVKALWVRIDPPKGLRITRSEAPELFELIGRARARLNAPKAHVVMLDDSFNAYVSQVPRLGVFGWQKNYLVLGLPLLSALTPAEFDAVLAHEFGHISGAHGKFGAWIYRVQTSWRKLTQVLEEQEHWATFIFRRFFQWYTPFFSAYSFVLRRAHEYEADAAAADFAGNRSAADALLRLRVASSQLDEGFWPTVEARVHDQPHPPDDIYRLQGEALKETPDPVDQDRWLETAMEVETGMADTHPSLRDRLAALEADPRRLEAVAESAADRYLGASLPEFSAHLGAEWRERLKERWSAGFEEVQQERSALGELSARAEAGETLSESDAYARARLTESHVGVDAARPLYEHLVTRAPDHAGARFALGRLRLQASEETGLGELDAAMALDADAIIPGCRLAYRFLSERGRADEASAYEARFDAHQELRQAIAEERDAVGPVSELIPHGLPDEAFESLRDQMEQYPQVNAVYVRRKPLQHEPDNLLVLLVVTFRQRAFSKDKLQSDHSALQAHLADRLKLPWDFFLVARPYKKKERAELEQVYGEPVYETE